MFQLESQGHGICVIESLQPRAVANFATVRREIQHNPFTLRHDFNPILLERRQVGIENPARFQSGDAAARKLKVHPEATWVILAKIELLLTFDVNDLGTGEPAA